VLRNNGIPEKLVNLLENIYNKSVGAVQVDGELLEWFAVTVGVRQGCNLSPDQHDFGSYDEGTRECKGLSCC